jgi:hypothetical protein
MSAEREERKKYTHSTVLAADAHSFNFAPSIYLPAHTHCRDRYLLSAVVCERRVSSSEDTSACLYLILLLLPLCLIDWVIDVLGKLLCSNFWLKGYVMCFARAHVIAAVSDRIICSGKFWPGEICKFQGAIICGGKLVEKYFIIKKLLML